MISHPKVDRPWEMICTAVMGPFQLSKQGNCYLLVVTDYLSKLTLMWPLRKATGVAVNSMIENEVFLMFGVPRIIICNNVVQYRSKEFVKLTTKYKIHIKYYAFHNPRANPTEGINRVIKTMISMYVSDNHRCWDERIAEIHCSLMTNLHES